MRCIAGAREEEEGGRQIAGNGNRIKNPLFSPKVFLAVQGIEI